MGMLTDVQIRKWVKAAKPIAGKTDGDGLTFTLSAVGTASWTLRYRINGKPRELTLGRYPDITLADARKLATARRAEIQKGVDVGREKRKTRQEAAQAWTFRRLADDYLARASAHLAESTIDGRRQQLRDYVHGRIGHLAAREVQPSDIVEIVERASAKSLHIARLVLIALREVFAHGVARHVVKENPCAHTKAKAIIGAPKDRRERIMLTDAELAAMLPALDSIGRHNALMVRVLLATATRIGEITKAEWKHIDLTRREWVIPAERAKNGKRFVIPLTAHVAEWFVQLKALAFDSRFVVPVRVRRNAEGGDKPMESTTLNAALNRLCESLETHCRRFTPHDLRSTCRSHLGALGVDVLIAERCLNHSLGGLVAVYDKHDYLDERRKALELWSAKIACLERGEAFNVIPLRQAAA